MITIEFGTNKQFTQEDKKEIKGKGEEIEKKGKIKIQLKQNCGVSAEKI